MATKVRLMKMLQEMRGFSEIARRYPSPKAPALYAIQLRSHVHESSHPRRKITIAVDLKDGPAIPAPVKITHLRPTSGSQHPV